MKNHTSRLVYTLALSLGAAAVAQAQLTIVNYTSGGYVSADTNFSRRDTTLTSALVTSSTVSFSDASVLSPTTGYSGQAFYGGYSLSAVTAADIVFSRQQIRNNNPTGFDSITIQNFADIASSAGNTANFAAVVLFKQTDWLNLTTGQATLSSLTSRVNMDASSAFNGKRQARWLIQADGNYYLSQATLSSLNFGADNTLTLAGSNWAAYNPGANLNFDQAGASFSALNFASISLTAVGLYGEADSYNLATSINTVNAFFGIRDFTATGTAAIPEPSTYGTFAAMAMLGLAVARRRRA